MIDEIDMTYLRRCVALARTAVQLGNRAFGSVLVSSERTLIREEHNRVGSGDHTKHPEFLLAQWAANNMSAQARAKATVYTSGEHCPMCAAAHAWTGLGRIVYASSSAQLIGWRAELGIAQARVRALPIAEVIDDTIIDGPALELADEIRKLHADCHAIERAAAK